MDSYYQSEEFRDILKTYEDYRDHGISAFLDSEEYADVAEYYHSQGYTDKAMEAVDTALEIFPGATLPLCLKARIAMIDEGNIAKAQQLAEQIEDKTHLEYLFLQAEILLMEHRDNDADQLLEEHYDNDSDDEDFILDTVSLFVDYQATSLAEKWFQRSTETDDDYYKEVLAKILLLRGKLKESEQLVNELIDRNPYSSDYWNQLASAQFLGNNVQDSISSSEFSLAINPNDAEATLNKANGLYMLENYEEAFTYFLRYAELQPHNETGELFAGLSLVNMNRASEAVTHLRRALTIAEKNPQHTNIIQILQELALVESQLGRVDDALSRIDLIEDYDARGIEIIPDPKALATHVVRGYILLDNNRDLEAFDYFNKAISESDAAPEVIVRVAVAFYDSGYLVQANALFALLLTTCDDDWDEGFAFWARCCYDLKFYDIYPKVLALAVSRNPDEARLVLSDLYPEEANPEDYINLEPKKRNK